ncbi:MAG: hypothetical protein ACUVWX_11940 [Kiritimatiellia bacterium]
MATRLCGSWPIRLPFLFLLHRLGKSATGLASPLSPLRHELDLNPAHIRHRAVRQALEEEVLTAHGVDVRVLNALCRFIEARQIRSVLEFGAGTSTLAFSILCSRIAATGANHPLPYVVSIEESDFYAQKAQELLARHGLNGTTRVLHMPLTHRKDYGLVAENYSFDMTVLDNAVPGWQPELVFVDGPSSGGSARAIALIDGIRAYGRLRYVLMDDALRSEELECMRYIARLGLVRFRGVIPAGKGLAVGIRV